MSHFNEIESSLLFSKNDLDDIRLGDLTKKISDLKNLNSNDYIIAGYPDDDGIKLNGGRIGASSAPNTIRQYLYKMTPSFLTEKKIQIKDYGNLKLGSTLEARHELAKKSASEALAKNAKWIALGGGHDYGYPDGAAFLQTFKQKPLIINFDAHLDVRPTTKGFNSGTPFYRILSEFTDFDFLELGIQTQCNSKSHYDWAIAKGAKILTWEELQQSGLSLTQKMLQFLEPSIAKKRDTFISIDIDGFSSNYAMGCSQSFATGFDPMSFFQVFRVLCERLDVKVLGIYEVSPPLDHDNRTSKLAAQIIHQFLFA